MACIRALGPQCSGTLLLLKESGASLPENCALGAILKAFCDKDELFQVLLTTPK